MAAAFGMGGVVDRFIVEMNMGMAVNRMISVVMAMRVDHDAHSLSHRPDSNRDQKSPHEQLGPVRDPFDVHHLSDCNENQTQKNDAQPMTQAPEQADANRLSGSIDGEREHGCQVVGTRENVDRAGHQTCHHAREWPERFEPGFGVRIVAGVSCCENGQ